MRLNVGDDRELKVSARRAGSAVVRFDRGDRLNALSAAAMRANHCARPRNPSGTIPRHRWSCSAGTHAGLFRRASTRRTRKAASVETNMLGERRAARPLMVGPRNRLPRLVRDGAGDDLRHRRAIASAAARRSPSARLPHMRKSSLAHFRIPEVELGMNMSWGSVPRILQLIGPARTTKQLVILASTTEAFPRRGREMGPRGRSGRPGVWPSRRPSLIRRKDRLLSHRSRP